MQRLTTTRRTSTSSEGALSDQLRRALARPRRASAPDFHRGVHGGSVARAAAVRRDQPEPGQLGRDLQRVLDEHRVLCMAQTLGQVAGAITRAEVMAALEVFAAVLARRPRGRAA